jgi:hypothetical protein
LQAVAESTKKRVAAKPLQLRRAASSERHTSPFGGITDIGASLKEASVGAMLEAASLLAVAHVLRRRARGVCAKRL